MIPKIVKRKTVLKGFFDVEELEIENSKTGETTTHHLAVSKQAVAILIYKPTQNKVIFTKQFRLAAENDADPLLLEIPAGVLDKSGEAPEQAACRECMEETGYEVSDIEHISTFYASPGNTNEKLHLFYTEVNGNDKKDSGGGLEEENEQIKIVEMDFDEALKAIDSGTITDSKTIIALLWLYRKKHS